MVVKERIVVDSLFSDINNCVKTVKEWFNTKGYKKITLRNPDRWSSAVILDIAKGGLMSKTTIQATFKSHAGGNSIMIELLASNDGTGLSGKPVTSAAPDPKDKPYEALAMDLSKFVKTTWKRGAGVGYTPAPVTAPSTMYQTTSPAYQSPVLQQPQQENYGSDQSQQQYGSYQQPEQQSYQEPQYGAYQQQAQTNYEAPVTQETYQQPVEQIAPEAAPIVEAPTVMEAPVVTEPEPNLTPEPVFQTPAPETAPLTEPEISDEEAARLEAELAAEEPAPEPERIRPGLDPSEVPTDMKLQFGMPKFESVDEEPPAYSAPPSAVEPLPEAPQPHFEVPAPEPLTPQPVLEPHPEIAPLSQAQPTPEAQPVQPTTPAETFCPGCNKKTKPKWRTCPYCEHDLTATKAAQPAVETSAPAVEAPVEAVTEPVVSQAAPIDVTQTIGNVTATCPTCPTCGQAPAWIDDYKRYYCYTCSLYL